jgi:CubicO group peptidase (beta-lactamase class C family)
MAVACMVGSAGPAVAREDASDVLRSGATIVRTHAASPRAAERIDTRVDPRSFVDGYFPQPRRWILRSGSTGDTTWRMTALPPGADWTQPGYPDSSWTPVTPGIWGGATRPGDRPVTPWPSDAGELWLRTTFNLRARDIEALVFWGRVDDSMQVYVNGVLALDEPAWSRGYRYCGLRAQAKSALRTDAPNTLAVHVRDVGGDRYFDLGLTIQPAFAAMPSTGFERTPVLGRYGDAMRAYMLEHGLTGGVLAVTKQSEVVVNRAFGWADKRLRRPLEPDTVMRLASNDKVITTGAIARLIDTATVDPATGRALTWDTPVFPLLRAHGLEPIPGRTPDARADTITLRHLHEHRGGLQELPPPERFYAELGVPDGAATTAEDGIRWAYSTALEFTPGDGFRYSSIGYAVLRHVAHVVTGDLLAYLRDTIFEPAGTRDVFVAHERVADRDPREPGYATLEPPYDRWIYLENFTALATSAEAMARYLRRYSMGNGALLIDPQTGQWSPGPEGNGGGRFYGSMAGTWSWSEQRRWDEVNIVVIFNLEGDHSALADQLVRITDEMQPGDWGLGP